jgi:restriction system protein
MGYGEGKVTRRSRDGGIDGIINEDKLGLEKIFIQAKRWQPGNNVGRTEIEGFVGAIDRQRGDKGVFITTSDFSREAYDHSSTHVSLVKINGNKLAELMIQYNIGVTNKTVYKIKKIDLDYFDEA